MGSTIAGECSASRLAYLGDAVLELLVREMLLSGSESPTGALHTQSKEYISAPAQSRMFSRIYESLNSDEQTILRRGRNVKTGSRPKHVSQAEYQRATGLEALFGYLYLKGDTKRLREIFILCAAVPEESD